MNPDTVFIGTNGKIGAYKLTFNDEKIHDFEKHEWTQELKGAGYHLISMALTGVNGVLYAATNGHIYCIDPLDGKIRWEKQPDTQKGLFKSDLVCLAHFPELNYIFVAGSGWVVCLDGKNGDFIWESKVAGIMGKNTSVTLLTVKSLILVGVNGFVHALDIKTGNEVWKNDLEGKGYGPVTLAHYSFQQHGTYSEELIIVGCNGFLVSLDLNSGVTRGSYNMKGTGYHVVALIVDSKSNTVFAATYGQVYALNPQSFHLKWKSDLPGMGYSHGFGLNYHDEKIYVGIQGKVACLDAKDGNMIWKDSLDGSGFDIVTLAVHHHTLLAMSNGRFYGIDVKNGKTVWKNSLSGMGYSQGSVSTAFYNTDFNSTTISGHIEALREEAARAASTSH